MIDWRAPNPEFLPGVLVDIARVVGMTAALKVAAHWSGRRYVRAIIGRDHELAKLVGHKAAQMIAEILRADHADGHVVIPNAASQRRWLAIARLYAGQGMSPLLIARRVNMDPRTIERIVRGIAREGRPAADHECRDDAPCAWCGRRPGRARKGPMPPAPSSPQLDMFPLSGPATAGLM